LMGKNDQSTDTVSGIPMTKASYDYVDVYLTNGVVLSGKRKKQSTLMAWRKLKQLI
jgi:hypothetical protein